MASVTAMRHGVSTSAAALCTSRVTRANGLSRHADRRVNLVDQMSVDVTMLSSCSAEAGHHWARRLIRLLHMSAHPLRLAGSE